MSKIYIIIINYNGWKDTIECLESVLKSDYKNYQVIVVDNDSPNNSMEKIIDWAEGKQEIVYDKNSQLKHLSQPFVTKPLEYVYYSKEKALNGGDKNKEAIFSNPIVFIQSGENSGFAAGNNIALKYLLRLKIDACVWILNPDIVIENKTLSSLVDCSIANPNKVLGTIHKNYFDASTTILYGGWKIYPYLGIVRPIIDRSNKNELDFISGGSLFMDIKIFDKFGLLPEEYFLYWEEADWCTKLKRSGILFHVCENSICYDKGSTSIGKNSYLAEHLYALNSLRYTKKYYKNIHLVFVTFFLFLKAIKRIIQFKKNSFNAVMMGIIEYYRDKC